MRPPLSARGWGGGVEPPTKFPKRRGLDRALILRRGLVRNRGWPFWEGGIFENCLFCRPFFFKTTEFEIPKFPGNQNMDKSLLYLKNPNILWTYISSYSCTKSQFFFSIFTFSCVNYSYREMQIPFKESIIETFCQVQLNF